MSLFCLAHGSTQNSSGWTRLVSELQKRGHRVVCADLPTDEPDANGARYAQAIADVNARLQRSSHGCSSFCERNLLAPAS